MNAMNVGDYPPQEPLSEFGRSYFERCMALSCGVSSEEHRFGPDPSQSIAFFRAPKGEGACLLFLHGGGWTNGYKEMMAFFAPPLNAHGISLASAGYRLAPSNVHPAQFEDVAAAFAYLHRKAEQLGISPERLFVGGHSAGGHLTSLLAVRSDWQALVGVPLDAIRGCLPISATFDFTPGCGLAMRPRFLGAGATEVDASPLSNLNRQTAFLVATGESDFPHLILQARRFALVAAARGCDVEEVVIPGADHLSACYEAPAPKSPWLLKAIGWMRARAV